MKLPFNRPRTSRSPSGYAPVISAPSLAHARRDLSSHRTRSRLQRATFESWISDRCGHRRSDEPVCRTDRLPRRCGVLLESRRSSPPLDNGPPGAIAPRHPRLRQIPLHTARPWAPDGASRSPARQRLTTSAADVAIAALHPSVRWDRRPPRIESPPHVTAPSSGSSERRDPSPSRAATPILRIAPRAPIRRRAESCPDCGRFIVNVVHR